MAPTKVSTPLSDFDKLKKDILSLDYIEFCHLIAMMLHGYEASSYDINSTISPVKSRVSVKKTDAIIEKLAAKGFAYTTWRSVGISRNYKMACFFAADQLKDGHLKLMIDQVNRLKRYNVSNHRGARYVHRQYADISIRAMHKILLDLGDEFYELYSQLTVKSNYLVQERLRGLSTIESILGTLDWKFWASREMYFQELAFQRLQANFLQWNQQSAPQLQSAIINLFDTTSKLPEIARVSILMSFDYFQQNDQIFKNDPGLKLISNLNSGQEVAAGTPGTTVETIVAEEDPVGFVEIVQTAFAYGKGHIDSAGLSSIASTFKLSNYPTLINCFLAYMLVETRNAETGEELYEKQILAAKHPLEWLVALWCAGWMGYKLRSSQLQPLLNAFREEDFQNLGWLRNELLYALMAVAPAAYQSLLQETNARTQVESESQLYRLIDPKPNWAYTLRQLRKATAKEKSSVSETQFRTIWIIDFDGEEIICKEQKMGKKGWTKGRKLRWTEILRPKNPEALHDADHRAITAMSLYDGKPILESRYYSEDMIYISFGKMLHAIADHPRIYVDESKRIPIELTRAEAELQVTETENGLQLKFDPPVETAGYVWRKITPTRYRVYHLTEDQAQMAFSIGEGVEIPADEREQLETIVEDIRPKVKVQSTLDLLDEDLDTIVGSSKPCFHLLPFDEGYKIELYVKPVPDQSFYFKPGAGLPRSIIVIEEGRMLLERPLPIETEEAAATILSCPTLSRTPQENYEWNVSDTQTALRILLELRKLVLDDLITIEHPKGEKLKIAGLAGQDELAIKVGKTRDWFEVEGALTVNEDRVADLQTLFEHLRTQKDNPFIELAEGEFLAITDELRDKVLEMQGLLHARGNRMELPTLAAGAFAEIAEDLEDIEFTEEWHTALDRIKKAEKLRVRVPKSFNAELRDYQKEGFKWMMRLAEWGVGGCLADDMGLGKTVQALAMLTSRAKKGPSLVIAPASVTRNWVKETEKFAPGLLPVLISSTKDQDQLAQLGKGDLALVSYGLLPFIGDSLQEIDWNAIVIDEAQAIKNAATKRARIVQSLSADFKLATTGTPIENHLGELWSLFRFLNPGLLGSKQAFNTMYNRPIAVESDEGRRNALKNLVKPFILRRRKDQVLTELPPKTEIVLEVDLSEDEKALYEALRRIALEEIASAGEQERRFTVLAQLTKLRQAACHPRLVRPTSKIGSAKLELVGETMLEILESGHKALIFSQFVKHLKIVENWVKGQGIPYQYLDGSTPGKKREESVTAFQAGEGKVFLISLKAGGTGLNLTEADYVLHLDPWWNPAAEDQASDRAHRIGQQRPVTVYRFVSQGTIEEQIIALHAEKRDLADQILSGTGRAGSLGVDEILTLLKQ